MARESQGGTLSSAGRKGEMIVLPGSRELLTALKQAGIPRAVGSSTSRINLDAIFASTGLGEFFDVVVSAEDVINGKPAPDVFLKAAELLGIPPQRCIVFEDALFGIEAARRAGMKVVAVATTNPLELLSHADRAVQSLAEISIQELQSLSRRRSKQEALAAKNLKIFVEADVPITCGFRPTLDTSASTTHGPGLPNYSPSVSAFLKASSTLRAVSFKACPKP